MDDLGGAAVGGAEVYVGEDDGAEGDFSAFADEPGAGERYDFVIAGDVGKSGLELGNDAVPALGESDFAGGDADVVVWGYVECGVGLGEEAIGMAFGCFEAVFTVDDEAFRSGVIVGDGDEAAGHAFEDDVSEGLGFAGEKEDVGGGVVAGEFVAGLDACEVYGRVVCS